MRTPSSLSPVNIDLELQRIADMIESNPGAACGAARAVARQHPEHIRVHRLLALTLRRLGNVTEAERAELAAVQLGLRHPAVASALAALEDDRLDEAEKSIRAYLRSNPEDAGGALVLGSIAERCGAQREAENLFRRAILLAPAYLEARIALAKLLNETGRVDQALEVLDEVLGRESTHLAALSLKAGILVQLRRLEEAQTVFKRLLRNHPRDGRGWMNYGFLLKTAGQATAAIDAYRKSVTLRPTNGMAWWGLANLKTVMFDLDDITAMQQALAHPNLDETDAIHLHFALGKALGDNASYADSFDHYATGNRLRLAQAPHDPAAVSEHVDRATHVFTKPFFSARADQGDPSIAPIFIVSLPRSGSTLVEQILASHPLIEGTEELYDIERIALELAPGKPAGSYLDAFASLDSAKLRSLGEHYLSATRRHRQTELPHFTDKMPGNWVYTGLIHTILPRAKIIDVRRHPLGCGFANFSQHYNWGINFAYDLNNIGLYYRQYVALMQHFDTVIPGKIHRVFYEDLISDTEAEIRKLLNYLELPFDPACLRFFDNRRAVHTPSSEQVRRPINRDGLDRWHHYEPWLGPLKAALGPVLTDYPNVPRNLN